MKIAAILIAICLSSCAAGHYTYQDEVDEYSYQVPLIEFRF